MNRVPEPALVRSAIVAVTGVLAVVLGRQIDISWLDTAITLYAALSPIVAGWLIRRVVSPVAPGRHAKLEE